MSEVSDPWRDAPFRLLDAQPASIRESSHSAAAKHQWQELATVVGPPGSGKTTYLESIAGSRPQMIFETFMTETGEPGETLWLMGQQLRDCPFCGGPASLTAATESTFAVVECATCGAQGPGFSGQSDVQAIDDWNERA